MHAEAKKPIKNEDFETNKKISFRFELVLFFVLGFLLGIVIKTEALKRVTIGYDDNSVPSLMQAYNFDKIKADITASQQPPAGTEDQNNESQPPAGNNGDQNNPGNQASPQEQTENPSNNQ